MKELFRRFSHRVSDVLGTPWAFVLALLVIAVWAVSGPVFRFSDTWQLLINTGTTIVTFLMVFIIQNTQNRDARAIHLKLDELLRAVHGARTGMIDLENLTDEELDILQEQFRLVQAGSQAVITAASKEEEEREQERAQSGNGSVG
jgi:low affinity Fe/Cu permease